MPSRHPRCTVRPRCPKPGPSPQGRQNPPYRSELTCQCTPEAGPLRPGPLRSAASTGGNGAGGEYWFRPREIPSLTDRRRSQWAQSGGYKEGGRGRWRGKVARHGGGLVPCPLWVPWGCPGSRGHPPRHSGALRGGRSRPVSALRGVSARWRAAGPSPAAVPPAYRETDKMAGPRGGQGAAAAPCCREGGMPWQPRCRLWGTVGLGCGGVAEGRLC